VLVKLNSRETIRVTEFNQEESMNAIKALLPIQQGCRKCKNGYVIKFADEMFYLKNYDSAWIACPYCGDVGGVKFYIKDVWFSRKHFKALRHVSFNVHCFFHPTIEWWRRRTGYYDVMKARSLKPISEVVSDESYYF
jgi:hypothetical protein